MLLPQPASLPALSVASRPGWEHTSSPLCCSRLSVRGDPCVSLHLALDVEAKGQGGQCHPHAVPVAAAASLVGVSLQGQLAVGLRGAGAVEPTDLPLQPLGLFSATREGAATTCRKENSSLLLVSVLASVESLVLCLYQAPESAFRSGCPKASCTLRQGFQKAPGSWGSQLLAIGRGHQVQPGRVLLPSSLLLSASCPPCSELLSSSWFLCGTSRPWTETAPLSSRGVRDGTPATGHTTTATRIFRKLENKTLGVKGQHT